MTNKCQSFNLILNKWSDLIRWRSFIRVIGGKVVATNGCFDILHVGHIKMLEKAASLGTHLVVGLNSDSSVKVLKGPTRPVNPQEHRQIVLRALRCVSYVHIFDDPDCSTFLRTVEPHVYVKAGDYTLENMHKGEKAVLDEFGTEIVFTKFVNGVSTTNILGKLAG